MKRFLVSLLLACSFAAPAAEEGSPLDRFPTERVTDVSALQNGAKLFVNYCLNCHGASMVRYNRLTDPSIGLTEDQIKDNLLFAGEKVGETMTVALQPKQGKEWFGTAPPDLSLVARSRASGAGSGSDYLYTYLRTFYRDDTKATGWNNLVFPNVAMPHALVLRGFAHPLHEGHQVRNGGVVFGLAQAAGADRLETIEHLDRLAGVVRVGPLHVDGALLALQLPQRVRHRDVGKHHVVPTGHRLRVAVEAEQVVVQPLRTAHARFDG